MLRLFLALCGLASALAQSRDTSITAFAAKAKKANGVDEAAILMLLGLDGRHSTAARCTWQDSSDSTSPASSSEGDSTDETDETDETDTPPADTERKGNTTSASPAETTEEEPAEGSNADTIEESTGVAMTNRTSLFFARDVMKSLGFGKRSNDHSSKDDSDLFLLAVVRTGDNVLVSRTPATYNADNPSYNGTMSNGRKFSLSAERSRRRLVSMNVEQDDGQCVLLFEVVAGSVLGLGKSRGHSISEAGIVELQRANATSTSKSKSKSNSKSKRKSGTDSEDDSCSSSLTNETFAFARSSLLAVLGSFWGATWTEDDTDVELYSISTGDTFTLSGGEDGDELTLREGGKNWFDWWTPSNGRHSSRHGDGEDEGEDEEEGDEDENSIWGLPFGDDSDSTSASCTYTAKVSAGTVMGVSAPKGTAADTRESKGGASRKGPGLRGMRML